MKTLDQLKIMVKIHLAIIFNLKRMIVKMAHIIENKEATTKMTIPSKTKESNTQKTIERRRKRILKVCKNKISSWNKR